MSVRFVSRSGATVRLASNTMDALLAASNVKEDVDRGDGTVGTYAGGVDVDDVVDPQYVIVGQYNYVGGEAGTFAVPSESDVRIGTGYGAGGTQYTGTLSVPDYSSVTDSASRTQQVCEALVALLGAADVAEAFYETLGAARTYTTLDDMSGISENVNVLVVPEFTKRFRTSNGTYARVVIIEIAIRAHQTNNSGNDTQTTDKRVWVLEQIDNFLASEDNSDLTLPDGKNAEYIESTDQRVDAEVVKGIGDVLWDRDGLLSLRQAAGLVRVGYLVDESY